MNTRLAPALILILTIVVFAVGLGVYIYNRTLSSSAPVSETPTIVVPEILYNASRIEQSLVEIKFFVVYGLIQNNQSSKIGSVRINATYYDATNKVMNSSVGGTPAKVIKPGQKAPFQIYFSLGTSGKAPSRYVLSPSAIFTNDEPIVGVEVVNSTQAFDKDGYHVVRGYTKNTGVMNAYHVKTYGVYYNSEGRVTNMTEGYVSQSINPGVTLPFELSSKPNKVDFAEFEVLVFASNYEWFYFWRYGSPQVWLLLILVGVFVLFLIYMKMKGW